MELTINKDELYGLIKKAVREVLQEERIDFFLKSIPYASKDEIEDIEKLYGKPPVDKKVDCSEIIEI